MAIKFQSKGTGDEVLTGGDWGEVFEFADGDFLAPSGLADTSRPSLRFNCSDVSEVYAFQEGWNDGDDWLCVGRLSSGVYFFLTAWCDYTGWDCQSGGQAFVSEDLERLLRFGVSASDRRALGLDGVLAPEGAAQ